jgi:hypothetical protein
MNAASHFVRSTRRGGLLCICKGFVDYDPVTASAGRISSAGLLGTIWGARDAGNVD